MRSFVSVPGRDLWVEVRRYQGLGRIAPGEVMGLTLFPRSTAAGLLKDGPVAAHPGREGEAVFEVTGHVARLEVRDTLLVIAVVPNPQGRLKNAFKLPLQLEPELLAELQRDGAAPGSGWQLQGHLTHDYGLLASAATPVEIGVAAKQ